MKSSNQLLIVFVKNILLGKVKTRLAKTVGNQKAFEVYKHLVEITEKETSKIENCDVHIYFSDVIIKEKWPGKTKFVQKGEDLGIRMMNAFKNGFDAGYESILGVGSDIPDLNAEIIEKGFEALKKSDTVFGPAEDGGYYLIGMNSLIPMIFLDKPWSQDGLFDLTISELQSNNFSVEKLQQLNDIDTIEDLRTSFVNDKFNL